MPISLQSVFDQFDPRKALDATDDRYVDCLRERHCEELLEQLTAPLSSGDPASLFFSGVLGDGKTTILNRFRADLEKQEYFVAYGEADELLDLSSAQYENIMLAILTVVDRELRERFSEGVEPGPLRQVWDELNRIANLVVEIAGETEIPLGHFVKLTAKVKDSPDINLQVRQRLRQAKAPTFPKVVNEYLGRAREIIEKCGSGKLLVILDNLDRLSDYPAAGQAPDEVLFLRQASQLMELNCQVIYVVRMALVHEHAVFLSDRYGATQPIIVPMIPVRNRDGSLNNDSLAKLREVIDRRLAKDGVTAAEVFRDPTLIDRLCEMSGGFLRGLMSLVRASCVEAMARQSRHPGTPSKITSDDVDKAIDRLGAQARLNATGYMDVLSRVAEDRYFEGIEPAKRLGILQRRLVYQYYEDGDYWFAPIPLLFKNRGGHVGT